MEVFKSQNEIEELEKLSEYVMANLYKVVFEDGKYHYDILSTINFPEDMSVQTYDLYIPNGKEAWTTISYRFYGTIKLWWIIVSFNRIMNPMDFPDGETKIKIPNITTIRYIIDKINNQ
jgi:hypothetical protein